MIKASGKYAKLPEYLHWFERNGFVQVEDERIRFLDVVTGEKLSAENVPECIAQDPICGKGLEQLQQMTQDGVSLELVFNYHNADDFSNLAREAGDLLQSARVVGLEWNGDPNMGIPQNAQDIRWEEIKNVGMGAYIRATQELVGIRNTVPCDIDHPISDDDTLRRRLDELLDHGCTPVDKKRNEGREAEITLDEWRQYHLSWLAYHNIRGWAMMGTLGYMASLYNLGPGDSVAFVVGSGHSRAIPYKLERLDIDHSITMVRELDGSESDNVTTRGMLGKLTLTDIDTIARNGKDR